MRLLAILSLLAYLLGAAYAGLVYADQPSPSPSPGALSLARSALSKAAVLAHVHLDAVAVVQSCQNTALQPEDGCCVKQLS